jgi:hypothetical protein
MTIVLSLLFLVISGKILLLVPGSLCFDSLEISVFKKEMLPPGDTTMIH